MAFQKGHKKVGGRTKGTLNKCTNNARLAALILRMEIVDFCKQYKDQQLMDDLMSLKPLERIRILEKFLKLIQSADNSIKSDSELFESTILNQNEL